MDERIITEQEEQAIRLCHHDHDGCPTDDAARVMGITSTEVKALLRSVKRKAPQLFPILSPRQRAILDLSNHNFSRTTIASALSLTPRVVKRETEFLCAHRFLIERKIERYDPAKHDEQVKERF